MGKEGELKLNIVVPRLFFQLCDLCLFHIWGNQVQEHEDTHLRLHIKLKTEPNLEHTSHSMYRTRRISIYLAIEG